MLALRSECFCVCQIDKGLKHVVYFHVFSCFSGKNSITRIGVSAQSLRTVMWQVLNVVSNLTLTLNMLLNLNLIHEHASAQIRHANFVWQINCCCQHSVCFSSCFGGWQQKQSMFLCSWHPWLTWNFFMCHDFFLSIPRNTACFCHRPPKHDEKRTVCWQK